MQVPATFVYEAHGKFLLGRDVFEIEETDADPQMAFTTFHRSRHQPPEEFKSAGRQMLREIFPYHQRWLTMEERLALFDNPSGGVHLHACSVLGIGRPQGLDWNTEKLDEEKPGDEGTTVARAARVLEMQEGFSRLVAAPAMVYSRIRIPTLRVLRAWRKGKNPMIGFWSGNGEIDREPLVEDAVFMLHEREQAVAKARSYGGRHQRTLRIEVAVPTVLTFDLSAQACRAVSEDLVSAVSTRSPDIAGDQDYATAALGLAAVAADPSANSAAILPQMRSVMASLSGSLSIRKALEENALVPVLDRFSAAERRGRDRIAAGFAEAVDTRLSAGDDDDISAFNLG